MSITYPWHIGTGLTTFNNKNDLSGKFPRSYSFKNLTKTSYRKSTEKISFFVSTKGKTQNVRKMLVLGLFFMFTQKLIEFEREKLWKLWAIFTFRRENRRFRQNFVTYWYRAKFNTFYEWGASGKNSYFKAFFSFFLFLFPNGETCTRLVPPQKRHGKYNWSRIVGFSSKFGWRCSRCPWPVWSDWSFELARGENFKNGTTQNRSHARPSGNLFQSCFVILFRFCRGMKSSQ